MDKSEARRRGRLLRHRRVRRKISGTESRPRLALFRSLKHIYAQVINDEQRITLVSVSSLEPDFRTQPNRGNNIAGARLLGGKVAERALQKGIAKVVFDKGGYAYHGRVKALAEAARGGGLQF